MAQLSGFYCRSQMAPNAPQQSLKQWLPITLMIGNSVLGFFNAAALVEVG